MSSLLLYNIAEKLLNSVAETISCKQFILYILIQLIISDKIVHNKR